MAYPFAQMPTWGDLRDRLIAKHNCILKSINVNGVQMPYLERMDPATGITYSAVVQPFPDTQRLTPSVVRSICSRLHLQVKDVEAAFVLN